MSDVCATCGVPVDGEHSAECPYCRARIKGSTEAFSAVGPPVVDTSSDTEVACAAGGPVLVVSKGPEVGERFFIDRERLTVGRDPACDIFLNDVTVSRSHAVLSLRGGEVSVEDVGSLNGTYVNGARVDHSSLADGDVIQIGTFQMVFLCGWR